MKIAIILAAILCAVAGAWAQGGDAASFLAQKGFPAAEFALKAEWIETAGDRLITGYSLQSANSAARLDLYREGDRLLTDAERAALSIRTKDWTASTASAPAERGLAAVAKSTAVQPQATGPLETLALPPYTPDKAFQFDAAGGIQEKAANQIGDIRPFTAAINVAGKASSLGRWHDEPAGGRSWRVGVLSPGATGQRLHLARYVLPPGARLAVYNPVNTAEVFTQQGEGGDLWLPTIFNELVVVEIFVEQGVDVAALAVDIDQTVHIYAPLTTFQKAAGACNLDVSCYPDWADTALGVCGIGTVTISGALFCTATLVADTDTCSTVPYVLTANHCVGGAGGTRGANNLEFYWFFQTPSCGGVAPGVATVPRTTGGADYLAGAGGTGLSGGGNDFTLVRMRNEPPSGVTYVGWDAADPALATAVTSIHHPRGEFKRIALGTLANTSNPHSFFYHEVIWNDGTTEPGSSGSPMFLASSQQVIGQLWGGGASCVALLEPDYYGRFSLTYPVVQGFLDPGPNRCGFASAALATSESLSEAEITVSLSRPAGVGGLSVDYAATAGTAVAGVDFTPVSGTLSFVEGEDTANFTVPLFQDLHADDGVTINLALSDLSCGEISATTGSAILAISDDDPDTDNDGLSDYDEVNGVFGPPTNPNLADSDDDGLSDLDEILDSYGYDTDPNNADTDGDGVPDFFEILIGQDPTIADLVGLSSISIPTFR